MTIGALAAFALYHAFGLPQGYWAVFTVVIVLQASLGGTLGASIDRLKGTLLGAVVGGFCAWLHPRTAVGLGVALMLSVLITAYIADRRPSLKVAPVTAVIMLVSPATVQADPLVTALLRVVEIALGSLIGVLAAAFIFPARSNRLAAEKAQAALDLLAALLERYGERLDAEPQSKEGLEAVHLRIRTLLGEIETALGDAEREPTSRGAEKNLSTALPRTLWRVRNDCISVSRALGPLPPEASDLVAAPMQRLMRAEADRMRRCGLALIGERAVAKGSELEALTEFEGAMATLRASRATHQMSLEPVGRLFGLTFALESLHRNLGDLADRIDEAAAARAS
jgi:uncharacterized membrane protein YccC